MSNEPKIYGRANAMTENEQRRLHELEGQVADLQNQLDVLKLDHNSTVIRTFILKVITGWAEGEAPFEEGVEMNELDKKIRRWRDACNLPYKWDDDIALYRRVVVKAATEDDTKAQA